MACFANDLQAPSLVVHQAKVHNALYDDSGPRQPGNDINIYLTSLIEDLRKLGEDEVDVWDANLQ